jgi:hypothetical protein
LTLSQDENLKDHAGNPEAFDYRNKNREERDVVHKHELDIVDLRSKKEHELKAHDGVAENFRKFLNSYETFFKQVEDGRKSSHTDTNANKEELMNEKNVNISLRKVKFE